LGASSPRKKRGIQGKGLLEGGAKTMKIKSGSKDETKVRKVLRVV